MLIFLQSAKSSVLYTYIYIIHTTMTKKQKQDDSTTVDTTTQKHIAELETTVAKLEKQITEKEEIMKRAQSDYMRTKIELDSYIQRTEANRQELKIQSLIDITKKLIPSINQLKIMVDTCPEELKTNKRSEWVSLLYSKLSKELESLNIFPIETVIWSDPHLNYHMPMGMEDIADEALKWKIVRELGQGYIYRKEEDEKVIVPSAVIVGS